MLADLIQTAVRKHVAEGVGVLLSGGIDSSTVAYFAPELPRFTGWYAGALYDERPYARMAVRFRADQVGPPPAHHEIQITPAHFIAHFDEMAASIHPPYQGPGTLGQYVVAQYAAQHVGTLLSGEGGDELFGGYARIHIVAGVRPPVGYENYQLPDGYPTDLEEALRLEFEEGLPALLAVDEQVCAAHDLQSVAPMLDQAVVDYVLAQPARSRVGKVMLRKAMEGKLPSVIIKRKDKMGFPVPFVEWAQREPVRSFVADRIGYVPAADRPWDRQWWLDLLAASPVRAAA